MGGGSFLEFAAAHPPQHLRPGHIRQRLAGVAARGGVVGSPDVMLVAQDRKYTAQQSHFCRSMSVGRRRPKSRAGSSLGSRRWLNKTLPCALQQSMQNNSAAAVREVHLSASERLWVPGGTDLPACRCGLEMHVASIDPLPETQDAHVRVYHCAACHHEMRLTVWADAPS